MQLRVESLYFEYAGQSGTALTNINLQAEDGDFIFIIGGNGSGKTTLLSCIAGLMPDMIPGKISGKILYNKDEYNKSNETPPLGYVLQESEIYLFSRVEDEIGFPLQNAGLKPYELKEHVRNIATFFALDKLLDREMSNLSGGELQRVAIAAALIKDAPILLLDEPFEQLDPDGADDLLQLLKTLTQKGKIVIVTARSFEYAAPYGNRLVLLQQGRVVGSGPAETAKELSYLVPECFFSYNFLSIRPEVAHYKLTKDKQDLLCTHMLTYKYAQGGGIEDINLGLNQGEILAIMGPNGAGKSTLIKHFIGLLKAQKGTVVFMGQNIATLPVSVITRSIGVLFQNPDDQIFNERIDKEIAWALKTRQKCSWEEAITQCQEIISSLGLEQIQKLHPHSVPRSSRQLVALASVLSIRPPIMILDEPGKSLDANHTHKLMIQLAKSSADKKQSIILVTHDPHLAWSYADRVALLADGKLLAVGTPEEILSNKDLCTQAKLGKHPFVKSLIIN